MAPAAALVRRGRGWMAAGAVLAAVSPAVLLALLAVLAVFAWPSIVWSGLSFFSGLRWDLGNLYGTATVVRHGYAAQSGAAFGALPAIVATAVSSLGALVLAVPIGAGVGIALADRAQGRAGRTLGFFVELLAGVPSVVFGLWGLSVLVPFVGGRLGPAIAAVFGFVPWLRGPAVVGTNLLTAILVLAVMVLPLVAALSRDAVQRVPSALREQGRALGLTEWEILRSLVLPEARAGILGGAALALGRALGETMAVLMCSGGGNGLPSTLYTPVTTMAAAIVSDLDSALTDPTRMAVHALAELAVVLLAISVLVNLMGPLIGRGASRVSAMLSQGGAAP